MKTLQKLCAALATLVALPVASQAQTRIYPLFADYNQALGAEVSYSLPAPISQGTTPLGNMDALHTKVGWLGTIRAGESHSWLLGAEWSGSRFAVAAGVPVPSEVHGLALKLGGEWRFADRWLARFEVDPGIYSDFADVSSDDLNAPFAMRLAYSPSTNLTWVLGINVDLRSGQPVVGGPGVRWKFAPDWTLNFIMPRPRIEFAANDSLSLFAGGELRGGSWRVAEDFGTRVTLAGLNNEIVDYREIRLGGGARWKLGQKWSAHFDAGWVMDRRFTFDRQNLLLNGDGAPYLQVGFLARF